MLTFLKKEKVNIAFLQETHLSDIEHQKLKRDWVGQVFFSSYTTQKRGTAILIHKNLPFLLKEQLSDTEGRFILIKGTLYGREITLMNIYAPNTDTPKFMSNIVTLFSQYCTSLGLLAGDFNCCFDANLDRSTFSLCNHNSSKALKLASSEVGLVDIWRELNPGTRDYSFYSTRHKSYLRIDMFLLQQEYIPFVNLCNIGSILIYDHAPV